MVKRPINHNDLNKVQQELLALQNASNKPLLSNNYQEVHYYGIHKDI